MSKVKLKPGDYVLTQGMDEDTYHKVARAFIEAGCGYGGWEQQIRLEFLGWWKGGLLFSSFEHDFSRKLTIAQVLGEEETAMPEVGSRWLLGGDEVEVLASHNGFLWVIWTNGGIDGLIVQPDELKPLKSERDKALDEMARAIAKRHVVETGDHYDVDRFLCYAEELYTDGYRKVG